MIPSGIGLVFHILSVCFVQLLLVTFFFSVLFLARQEEIFRFINFHFGVASAVNKVYYRKNYEMPVKGQQLLMVTWQRKVENFRFLLNYGAVAEKSLIKIYKG